MAAAGEEPKAHGGLAPAYTSRDGTRLRHQSSHGQGPGPEWTMWQKEGRLLRIFWVASPRVQPNAEGRLKKGLFPVPLESHDTQNSKSCCGHTPASVGGVGVGMGTGLPCVSLVKQPKGTCVFARDSASSRVHPVPTIGKLFKPPQNTSKGCPRGGRRRRSCACWQQPMDCKASSSGPCCAGRGCMRKCFSSGASPPCEETSRRVFLSSPSRHVSGLVVSLAFFDTLSGLMAKGAAARPRRHPCQAVSCTRGQRCRTWLSGWARNR